MARAGVWLHWRVKTGVTAVALLPVHGSAGAARGQCGAASHSRIEAWQPRFAPRRRRMFRRFWPLFAPWRSYERAPDAVTATEEGLLRDGFGPNPFYYCLIAEHDGQPAGFALYFFNYSTWMGQAGNLSRRSVCAAGVSRPGHRQGAAAAGGRHRRRKRLPAPAVGGSGLEYAGHRFLPRHGRRVSGRVAQCAPERRSAGAAGGKPIRERPWPILSPHQTRAGDCDRSRPFRAETAP